MRVRRVAHVQKDMVLEVPVALVLAVVPVLVAAKALTADVRCVAQHTMCPLALTRQIICLQHLQETLYVLSRSVV